MNNPWKILSSKIVYQNPWIRVREDAVITPDGSEGIYGVIESPDSVMVGAVNDNGEIYIIRSFSYPAQKWHWELPAGGSEGQDILEASKRELAEETGIVAKQWKTLGITRVADGLMTEKMHTLLATDLSMGEKVIADDSKLILEGKFASLAEIHQLIASGEMDEGQTITSLYFIEQWLASKV